MDVRYFLGKCCFVALKGRKTWKINTIITHISNSNHYYTIQLYTTTCKRIPTDHFYTTTDHIQYFWDYNMLIFVVTFTLKHKIITYLVYFTKQQNYLNCANFCHLLFSVKNPEKRAIFIEQMAQLSQQYKSDVLYGSFEVRFEGVVCLSSLKYNKYDRSRWVSQGYRWCD